MMGEQEELVLLTTVTNDIERSMLMGLLRTCVKTIAPIKAIDAT